MGAPTWPNLLSALLRAEELTAEDTAWAMGEIVAGAATPASRLMRRMMSLPVSAT